MAEAHNLTHNLTSLSVSRDGPPPGPRAPGGCGTRDTHSARTRRDTAQGPRHAHGATGIRRRHAQSTTVHAQCVLTPRVPRENYRR